MAMTTTLEAGRPPQQLREDLWLFPPNRDSQAAALGGSMSIQNRCSWTVRR